MECRNCSQANPPGARYCQNCESALDILCPNCGAVNGPSARFCQNCGHELGGEKPGPGLSSRSQPHRRPFESERRIVTILFADVKGSTAIAEQLDPEEWTEIMNGAFARLVPAITRYGGTVARLMGDAVLALFGAPTAHEDDPYRATLAAIDMINDLRPYQSRIRKRLSRAGLRPDPTDFEIRIGINTGLVIVGRVGSAQGGEYTAMGDAVNLAARLEQTAEPGMIQISHDTYRHVAPWIESEPLGSVEVRGKSERIRTYQVLGLKTEFQFVRAASAQDAPLIGRKQEMETLRHSLDQVLEGFGRIVCMIGEAGLGKSRLIRELKIVARDSPGIQWFDAVSLSFEASQPYGLLQRLFRRVCDCAQNDSPEKIRRKITDFVQGLPAEDQSQMGLVLNSLFSLEAENGQQALSGEDLKRELFTGMRTFWKYQAGRDPLVLVLDDLHWADPASVELTGHLFALAEQSPIFFLCVFRPDYRSAAWGVKQLAEREYPHRYREITLHPLSPDESHALVESLMQVSDLPGKARELILKKAEGNPFFMEEIVRELIEREMVLPRDGNGGWQLAGDLNELDIPDTLESVLVARIDRLEENARHTLQLAAVIGRSFYYRVLKLVAAGIDDLEQNLQTLQSAELIQEAARLPELEYIFRHVLTQEAAYNTILRKRRRHFHQRTGEIMAQLFGDRLDEHAPLLAYHFLQSGDYSRALQYLVQAAENAARLHANTEAIEHYSRAIELDLAEPLSAQALITLHHGRALAYERMGIFEKALVDLEFVLQTARKAEQKRDIWRALLDLGKLWASRNYQETGSYFEQALEMARELDDPAAVGRSLNRLGNWYVNAERPREGMRYHQEAKSIFDDLGNQRGQADTLDLLGMASLLGADLVASYDFYTAAISQFEELQDRAGLVTSLTGRAESAPIYFSQFTYPVIALQQSEQDAQQALELSREIGWRAGESFANWSLGQIYGVMGRFGEALVEAQIGLDIAIEIEHLQWMSGAYLTQGHLYLDLLDAQAAGDRFERSLDMAKQVGSLNFINSASGGLGRACVLAGDLERAHDALAAVLGGEMPLQSLGQRISWVARTELALAEGEIDLALDTVARLTAATSRPVEGIISTVWHLRGKILLAGGAPQEAEACLLAAIQNASHFGETTMLWRLHGTLGQAFRAQSRPQDEKKAILKARQIVKEISSTIPDRSLRKQFVERARAQLEAP